MERVTKVKAVELKNKFTHHVHNKQNLEHKLK